MSGLDVRVRRIICRQLSLPDHEEYRLADDARLVQDLGADSLDMVEMANALEEEFDVDISDAELEQVQRVADLYALVQRKKTGQRPLGRRADPFDDDSGRKVLECQTIASTERRRRSAGGSHGSAGGGRAGRSRS